MNGWHIRAYSALLRMYPRRFRADYRREMTLLFAQQLEDARAAEGGLGVLRLWVRSVVDLLATAPGEHLQKEALVAQPVVGMDRSKPGPRRSTQPELAIAALFPALIVAFLFVFAPHFLDPMFHKPPEALGLPLGTVVMALTAIWYGIGVVIVGLASWWGPRLLAFLVFIVPATLGFILGPAVVLIMENLTAQPVS